MPEIDLQRTSIEQGLAGLRTLRAGLAGRVSLEELLEGRHTGHKH